MGKFFPALSPKAHKFRLNPKMEEEWITTQPAIAKAYLFSFWFLIDFLAVFPFELTMTNLSFLGMSRALRLFRLPRLIRMVRVIRAVKTFKAYRTVQHAFKLNPATGRFILISVTVPWMMHIIACFIYFFESGAPDAEIVTYAQALDSVFLSFIANDDLAVVTYGGEVLEKLAIVLGFTFFGVFIGNFASYFENLDSEKLLYEEKKKDWAVLFKEYPEVFDKGLKKEILNYLLIVQSKHEEGNLEEQIELIHSLDHELESRIHERLEKAAKETPTYKLEKLKKDLGSYTKS